MQVPVKPRATIRDVAAVAGVSVATVDRVLNRRAPVKAATARRVLDAARTVGFHAAPLVQKRLDEGTVEHRLGFLLQGRAQAFYQGLGAALAEAAAATPGATSRADIDYLDDLAPGPVAEALERLAGRCDAVAVVVADHPRIAAAVEAARARGRPLFTLLSDTAAGARTGFFGIDHRKAGRTAAWAVSRLSRAGGAVGVMVGNHRYLGHELCEISFRSYLREHAPAFHVLDTLMSLEESRFAYETTAALLERTPDLRGLYVAGGGQEGAIAALRDHGAFADIVVVCNELIPDTRAALIDGVVDLVIATPVGRLARSAVAAMTAALGGHPVAATGPLPFALHTAENV